MIQKNDTRPRTYADGIPVYCAYDEIVPIGQLRPNPKNPNKHPQEQIEKLGKIIRGNGWRNPITVSTRSGLIVKGHGRLLTAELEELKEVPVEYQNYESEEAELADLTADNRIAELAEMDAKMLADIFVDIDTGAIDFEISGYTEDEYNNIASALSEAVHNDLEDLDAEIEPPEGPFTKYGDIWILGGCLVIKCGDSKGEGVKAAIREQICAALAIPSNLLAEPQDENIPQHLLTEYTDTIVKRWIKATGSNDVKCIRDGVELSREEISAIFND